MKNDEEKTYKICCRTTCKRGVVSFRVTDSIAHASIFSPEIRFSESGGAFLHGKDGTSCELSEEMRHCHK